jgi:hypothetical protein
MKEFNLNGKVTISVYTTVKANSLEEAIKIAKERDISNYHYSSPKQSHEDWINEEYDGEVFDIELDEE